MKYSVIVPIYKVEEFLPKCINSILCQTFDDFELILVDDGSPDNCPQICDEYAAKDSRVHVIHKTNGGLVNARNTGIKAAAGDYICYVDGDDWIETNLLETVDKKAFIKENPEMIVFGARRCFGDHEVVIPSGLPEGMYSHQDMDSQLYPYMMYDNRKPFCSGLIFPVAWNKIYKRDFLLEHYCKEERIRMGEDNAFIFECLYYANRVYFCDDILYNYNQLNSESMVHSYDPARFQNNKLLIKYIEKNLKGINNTLDNQINAFKAYWLIMAIFHEVKCKQRINNSVKHISDELRDGELLNIYLPSLPISSRIYIGLLKKRMYVLVLLGTRIIQKKRSEN